jgi:hypothetical protein
MASSEASRTIPISGVVKWCCEGIRFLATQDFRKFDSEQVVIHYGGSLASVDAYTFANSLVAFADTVRAINSVVSPGQDIEIKLEAQAPGSYRAVIRRFRKGIGGFFGRGAETVFWGLVAALIYDRIIQAEHTKVTITVNSDEVIYQDGEDRVIIPRAVYDQMPNVRKSPEVQENLSRTFKVIERDEAITDFGLTRDVGDAAPVLTVPRSAFHALAEPATLEDETRERTRVRRELARLVILKAWFTHARRKWSFEWNGVPISALIVDETFLDQIDRREYLIGSGDALDVTLTYKQNYDDALSMYVNDMNSFVVAEVIRPVRRAIQGRLPH